MPTDTGELTAGTILGALADAPSGAASDGSIQGLLAARGVEASRREIRRACARLVDDGRLELAGQKGKSKRYRVRRHSPAGRA